MFKRSLLATFTVLSMTALASAQGAPPDGQGGPGGPGGPGGGFNPQQRMLDRLHDMMGVEDDKWASLEPKIKKVVDAQRAAQVGRGGPGGPGGGPPGQGGPGGGQGGPGGGGPDQGGGGAGGPPGGGPPGGGPDGGGPGGPGGGPGGPPDMQNASEVQKAVMAIRELLSNTESPSAEEINAKLTVFRDALAKARTELTDARKDLKSAVDAKQEAILVAMGLLE